MISIMKTILLKPRTTSPLRKQIGACLVEYALLILLLAVVAFPAVGGVGSNIQSAFCVARAAVEGVGNWGHCLPDPDGEAEPGP